MADTRPLLPAGAYWGTIRAAAESQIGYVRALQAVQIAAGIERGQPVRFSRGDFQSLYTQAIRNREAARQLNSAAQGIALGPEHIGAIPNAAPYGGPQTYRRYLAVVEHIVQREGVLHTETRTITLTGGHPATKQALLNELNRAGTRLADDYEDEVHVGIGYVSLLAA